MRNKVKIVEVAPRDGLQNEQVFVKTEQKIQFIEKLIDAGLERIELTSFVSPIKVKQMSDAKKICEYFFSNSKYSHIDFMALVPNLHGLEDALASNVKHIAVFSSASNTFNMKNIGMSTNDSLQTIASISETAKSQKIKIRGYLSMCFGCPYQGNVPFQETIEIVNRYYEMGIDEISIGDTIGIATPLSVKKFVGELTDLSDIPKSKISFHFHDTMGMALANAEAAYQSGFSTFDSSAAGLGGCPYAKNATGNVATEDLFRLFDGQNIGTGINIEKLLSASHYILDVLKRPSTSKYYNYLDRIKK